MPMVCQPITRRVFSTNSPAASSAPIKWFGSSISLNAKAGNRAMVARSFQASLRNSTS